MTYTDRGQGDDVLIGGLPFKLDINGERPYERATAPFRKEQFDSAPTVGDQSLTGWWTRGQLSFHKGAGVTYYEVLDGETVFNRFRDSDSVDVFTPGKAALMPSLVDMSVNAIDAVPAPLSRGGGVYVLTDTGVEYTAGDGTTPIDTSDSGIPTSITSSGELFYVTNADTIEQQFDASVARTNHITNPSFETNTTGWSGTGETLSQTNYVTNPSGETGEAGWSGNGYANYRTNLIPNPSFETNLTGWTAGPATSMARIDPTSAPTGISSDGIVRLTSTATTPGVYLTTGFIAVTALKSYTLSVYAKAAVGNSGPSTNTFLALDWYDSSDVLISSPITSAAESTGGWTRYSNSSTAPANAAKVKVRIGNTLTPAPQIPSGDTFDFDAVLLEEGSDLLSYFDGDKTDAGDLTYAWTGTANGSTSTVSTDGSTLLSSTEQAKYGSKSLRVESDAGALFPASATYTVTGLTNGVEYVVRAWVYLVAQDRNVEMKVGSTVLGTSSVKGSWQELSSTFTATGTSHDLTFEHKATAGEASIFYIDGVLWTEAPWTGGYFDGSFTDGTVIYDWTGTPHASTSTASDSSTAVLERTATKAKFGSYSLKVSDEHDRPEPLAVQNTLTGLSIGVTYKLLAWVWVTTGGSQAVAMSVDAGGALATSATEGAWEVLTSSFTATDTTHDLKFAHSGSGDAAIFYIDAIMWTESPFLGGYFDGSQSGASWVGTPHASKSTYAGGSDSASVALWINSSADWVKAWWAKGRLWAVDADGYWYTLSPSGGTTSQAGGEVFWPSGKPDASWSLAEGDGPVYISDGFSVYAVTVTTDGVVPVLDTPTTAARVPLGEEIGSISYYLGYLIMPTSRGVRVALAQDTEVLLGPYVLEGDFTAANRIGAFDTKAYVVGRLKDRGGDGVLCVLDLAQFVSDLIPAWSPLATITDLASTASGAIVDADGNLYAWAAETLLAATLDDVAAEGYVTTGFHRFGTLEPKHFSSVLVRVGGEGGAITVSRIDRDETITELATITAPTEEAEIDLGMTASAERIGLKFTLARDADDDTVGPELVGYQLRALPAPKRQRMIRLPLMLLDKEQRGRAPAKGHTGSAWERMSALEAMERDQALVQYEDLRTGEAAKVLIESIEHQGRTPPTDRDTGFGGVVFVTLRQVS